jgi:broad specificity phosphatase PhoE/2'-5' RNA ligase/cation transport regulator ChaB
MSKLHVIHYSTDEDLPASVRGALPDAVAQGIFRAALNSHLRNGKSEMHSFIGAYKALEEAGYQRNGGSKWVQKDAPAVGDVHVDKPLGAVKYKPKEKDDPGTQDVNPPHDDELALPLITKTDKVTVDVPLLIRLLEAAREEIKDDEPLHVLAERLTTLSAKKPVLGMDDYDAAMEGVTAGAEKVAKRISGNSPIPLNAKGQKLAERLGKRLHDKGGLDALHSSPLRRAVQTADAIVEANPETKYAQPTDALRPWRLGEMEGEQPGDVHNLIAHYIENPKETPPGKGKDDKPGEPFEDAKVRQLDCLLELYTDCEVHPNMKVGVVMHSRGMELLKSWVDAGEPEDYKLDTEDLLHPDDPEHADVLRWHNGKIKEVDLDSDDELKPGLYLILHSLTDDDTDEGNEDLEKVESQTLQLYLPPLEVHNACIAALKDEASIAGITLPLSKGEGIPEENVRKIAKHFIELPEPDKEPPVWTNAWGGPRAAKWAARVIGKIEKEAVEKARESLQKADSWVDVEKAGNGIMIAFYPDAETAAKLALEDGEFVGDLHLTLAYLGKSEEVNANLLPALETTLKTFADRHAPVMGELGGPGRFAATEHSDGKDVCIAMFESKDIQDFRRELVEALEAAGFAPRKNFGYTPHTTLAYIDPAADLPVQRVDPIPVTFGSVVLCVGRDRKEFPLTGQPVDVTKYDFELSADIVKVDSEKQMVWGWFSVISIDGKKVEDTQKDVILPGTLEDAVYRYVLDSRKGGEMHDTDKADSVVSIGKLIESVVFTEEKQKAMVKSLHDMGVKTAEMDLHSVGWWGGFLVTDASTWKRVKSGELRAFSIGGKGKRAALPDEVEKTDAEADAELDAALRDDFGMGLAEFYKILDEGDLGDAAGIDVSKGGPGSGNFGHAGRPGEVGGSGEGGGQTRSTRALDSKLHQIVRDKLMRPSGVRVSEIRQVMQNRNFTGPAGAHITALQREGHVVRATRDVQGNPVYHIVGTRPVGAERPPGASRPSAVGKPTDTIGRKEAGFLKDKEPPPLPPRGVAINCNDPAAFARMVGLTPSQYTGALLSRFKSEEIAHVETRYSVSGNQLSTSLNMTVKAPDGSTGNLTMNRSIDLGGKSVDHDYFSIRNVQAGGVGKKLFDASLDLYDHMGIKQIGVHANLDVGGYAWARYGFTPTQSSWNYLRSSLSARAGEISDGRTRNAVERLLKSDNPRTIAAIAAIKTPAYGYNKAPVGKGLLIGQSWEGHIRLDKPNEYAQVRAYVRGK